MVNVTILEFIVYAIPAYSSILMLIISTIKEQTGTKSFALARAIYMILGVIFLLVLANTGPDITLPIMNTTTIAQNTSEVFTETVTGTISLLNGQVWMLAHFVMALILIVFVIQQILILLTKLN
jgi:hypothetical protein